MFAQAQSPPPMFSIGMAEILVIAAIVGLLLMVVNRGGRGLAVIVLGGVGLLFALAAGVLLYSSLGARRVAIDADSIHPLPTQDPTALPTEATLAEISGRIPVELETAPAPAPRPAWAETPPERLADGAYRTTVVAGPYEPGDPELERRLVRDVQAALDDYVETHLGAGASQQVRLSPPEMRDLLIDDTWRETWQSAETPSLGPMVRLHALLMFDAPARRRIEDRYRATLVASRLAYTGAIAGLALAVLAALYGYLKLDTLTRGYYSGRLKAAAGAVIMAAAVVAVMLVRGNIGF
jgi:hypothetical protein